MNLTKLTRRVLGPNLRSALIVTTLGITLPRCGGTSAPVASSPQQRTTSARAAGPESARPECERIRAQSDKAARRADVVLLSDDLKPATGERCGVALECLLLVAKGDASASVREAALGSTVDDGPPCGALGAARLLKELPELRKDQAPRVRERAMRVALDLAKSTPMMREDYLRFVLDTLAQDEDAGVVDEAARALSFAKGARLELPVNTHDAIIAAVVGHASQGNGNAAWAALGRGPLALHEAAQVVDRLGDAPYPTRLSVIAYALDSIKSSLQGKVVEPSSAMAVKLRSLRLLVSAATLGQIELAKETERLLILSAKSGSGSYDDDEGDAKARQKVEASYHKEVSERLTAEGGFGKVVSAVIADATVGTSPDVVRRRIAIRALANLPRAATVQRLKVEFAPQLASLRAAAKSEPDATLKAQLAEVVKSYE